MQTDQIVVRKSENTKELTYEITITINGERLKGEYEEYSDDHRGSCSIKITLNDFENYGQMFIFDAFDHIVYIDDFTCSGTIKGKGKKLLFEVLNYVRSIKGKKTYVTLLAASKERVVDGKKLPSNDQKLMAYYTTLGFRDRVDEVPGLMYGNIETVMFACSPEDYQSLPEPSPAAATRAEAATTAATTAIAAAARVQPPAAEAYFSSVSNEPNLFFTSSASASSSRSPESSDPSSRLRSTSVDPPEGAADTGGKKNHTHKKYTMKTRKNKKSKKRWSLKYKKSINCKRPRGFSQRQYCKYGRKKS
jgi:hypothetical protein